MTKLEMGDMPTVNIGTAENYFLCFEIHPTESTTLTLVKL